MNCKNHAKNITLTNEIYNVNVLTKYNVNVNVNIMFQMMRLVGANIIVLILKEFLTQKI